MLIRHRWEQRLSDSTGRYNRTDSYEHHDWRVSAAVTSDGAGGFEYGTPRITSSAGDRIETRQSHSDSHNAFTNFVPFITTTTSSYCLASVITPSYSRLLIYSNVR